MIAVNVFSKKERKRVGLFLVGAAGQRAREKRLGFHGRGGEAEKRGAGLVGSHKPRRRERRGWLEPNWFDLFQNRLQLNKLIMIFFRIELKPIKSRTT